MEAITNKAELLDQIRFLENQKEQQLADLKQQYAEVGESLKPMNLIKNSLFGSASTADAGKSVMNNLVGLATGYASKKLLFGGSTNPIKKVAGTLLQFAITNFIGKRKAIE